jgi:hypothetical protein
MKVAFLVNPHSEGIQKLESILKQFQYKMLTTQSQDEIDQAGKQSHKVILIFDESKFAYRFLVENRWPDFAVLKILYLPKKPVINADASKKLSSVDLHVFAAGEENLIAEKIKQFESNINDTLDLEFSVHEDLEKKV